MMDLKVQGFGWPGVADSVLHGSSSTLSGASQRAQYPLIEEYTLNYKRLHIYGLSHIP